MHVEKNVAKSIVETLLHVSRKTKDGLNARLDLAELGGKTRVVCYARLRQNNSTSSRLHNIKVPEGYCSNFSSLVNLKDRKLIGFKSHDYHMLMQEFLPIAIHSIMHPPTRYAIIRFCFFFKSICSKEIILKELDKMQAELVVTLCLLEKFFPLSFFDIMIHLTVHLTREVKPNTAKNEHSKSFAKWLREEVERELAIDKESVSETVRWISYGPRATVVKYDAYNINGYTFRTKCHDGKVYQNSGVSVEAIDLHISKEVATTRQAYYYGVLQEIWVLDYRFRQIPLFKCDWVNHKSGGVKRDKLGYTLVDLNNLGHKTPPKNYKDTYDEVDEEFSTVIHHRNDNVLPLVDRRDLANESRDDYYRKDCGGVVIRNSKLDKYYMKVLLLILNDSRLYKTGKLVHTARLNLILLRQQPVGMKPPAFATHHLAAATVAAANCLARMSGLKKVRGGLLPVEQPPCSLWSSQRRGTTSLRQWPLVTHHVGGHDSGSDNNKSDSYSTSEEIDYDSPEPPKSFLKWYHYLSDEYKDNGRFWGSKSGYNESDVKPSWKDIKKAKAQASEASSKAKVEARGSKAKLQASTKTLIVKSPVRITNYVLGLANAKTRDAIKGKTFGVKIQ
ncbi:helitron helicase-like domain-containing protein [Tanacetum coccineum]